MRESYPLFSDSIYSRIAKHLYIPIPIHAIEAKNVLRKRIMNCNKSGIKTWKQFARKVRRSGCLLLNRLDDFSNCVLVTGCQRSGTTMLSRIITQSEGMINYRIGKDDELDAALILSGMELPPAEGRYCFQTTYLNECYEEYFEHIGRYKMIWILRNPFSVVYSLLYHWRRWALNELFRACGADLLENSFARRYQWFGWVGVPKIIRGCLSYNGKLSQLFELKRQLPVESILIIEYDELVKSPDTHLQQIYRHINLPFRKSYCDSIHGKSTEKKNKLSENERELVSILCLPFYEKAKSILD